MKIFLIIFCVTSLFISCAEKSYDQESFDKMLCHWYTYSVPLVDVDEFHEMIRSSDSLLIIDVRTKEEYLVSHIVNAINIQTKEEIIKIKDSGMKLMLLYCSVGYRSELLGNELYKSGFTKVYNLNGGIFNYVNHNLSLVNSHNDRVKVVHGYKPSWGCWVREGKVVYE